MQGYLLSAFLVLFQVRNEAANSCNPSSWHFYDGYCFMAISGNTSYDYNSAEFACQKETARLASIHSSEELEFLRDNLTVSGLFYIGLKRNAEGEWMYNDTSSFNYSNWETDEPANHGRCVVLNTTTFKWFGESCNLTVDGALCRKPLVDTQPPQYTCVDTTVELPPSVSSIPVNFIEPVIVDESSPVTIFVKTNQPGDVFHKGIKQVTYVFKDPDENTARCTFSVTVKKGEDENTLSKLDGILQYVDENKHNGTINVTEVSAELVDFTSSTTEFNETEVDIIAGLLNVISELNSSSSRVTSFVLTTTDNIVTAVKNGDAVISENSSEIILQSLEQQVENVQRNGQNFSQTGQNIQVNVVHLETFEAPIRFESFNGATNVTAGLRNIYILDEPSEMNNEAIVSIQVDPQALLNSFPPGQDTLPVSFIVHRTDALFQNSKTENSNLEVNSFIIAASTSVPIRNLPPESLVMTTFFPLDESLSGATECMFWNHTLHGILGGWSGEGCHLEENNTSKFFLCNCNHLTSFAILVSPSGDPDDEFSTILTIIGCIISIICLALTVVSLSATPNIRSKTPQKIIIHLSLALLGLYVFFLIGVNRTDLQTGCVIFGAFIHFFCLASIAWMSVEATNMYLMFVKVINANVRYFTLKASFFAWGFPLVTVVTCAVVSPLSYNNERCFPHNESMVFYISMFAFVVLLLIYNLFMFLLVMFKLTCSRKRIASASNSRQDTIRRLQNAFAISVLLGLTWTFGLFPVKDLTLHTLSSILFSLFNSLQGCFIFLLFVFRQKEIRNTWMKWLHIRKRSQSATKSTGLSSQTDKGPLGQKKGSKGLKSDVSSKTEFARSNVETEGL